MNTLPECEVPSSSLIDRASVNRRWQAVLARDPCNELALIQLASNHLADEDAESAGLALESLARLPHVQQQGRYLVLCARHANILGNEVSAIDYWEKAAAAGHDPGAAYLNIAGKWAKMSMPEKARDYLSRARAQGHWPPRARLLEARCCMLEYSWKPAIELLEDLDSFGDLRASAARMLFHCYMNDHRNASASRLCELLEQDEQPGSYHLHGQLMFRKNRYADALEKFTRAIDLDGSIDSRIWLIKTLTSIHDEGRAVEQIRLVEQLSGANALIQARCWEAAGVLSKAEWNYQQAIVEQPCARTFQALIRFHHTYRQWDKAYLAIAQASRAGYGSIHLDQMRSEIRQAYSARGRRLPIAGLPLRRRQFRSSEEMVSGIVERSLARIVTADHRLPGSVGDIRSAVLVIGSLGPGGAERQVVNLANGLVRGKDPLQVNLLCTHLSRKEQDRFYEPQVDDAVVVSEYYDKQDRLDPADIPELAEYAEFLQHVQPESRRQTLLHMARSLAEIRPDVVHGWLDETFINTALVCAMLGIRNCVGRWGSMPAGVNRTVNERDRDNIGYLEHAYRQIAKLPCVKYSSNSRLTGNAYADLMGIEPGRVEIVYNGVDQDSLTRHVAESPDLKRELGLPPHALVVGTIFRISEEKRPELWLDVAESILNQHPEVHFVMVGSGPLEGVITEKVNARNLVNVHLVGKQENVGAWYSLFDVLLLTSRVEGVSNVVVESQLCGCPVVAPDVGGLSEAILDDETGYLLSDHSVEGFAQPVKQLLADTDLRQRMSRAAVSYASEKFSIGRMVENYRQLFARDH